jgi:pyrimidine-nucleoside phosphorylase
MIILPLIERKRDGGALTTEEWGKLIQAYAAGHVPDYQMAALLMAVWHAGLEEPEIAALTDAMCRSGATLEFGDSVAPRVDKHSTGGVGDKISLVLAPLVAAAGAAVPMISGRGLGHTGGTLDKLQSIPGFRIDLTLDEMRRQVERIGVAMLGQTSEIAPADQKLYALRDATATVETIPLMAPSIMSKKLAEGLNGLVLDIKTGSGAFLPETERGLELAQVMVRLGEERGCPTVALLTAMDRPLGRACGNAVEVAEALAVLRDDGPADVRELSFRLGVEMLAVAGVESDRPAARRTLESALSSGRALEKFRELVRAQGGDVAVVDDPDRLPQAPHVEPFVTPRDGIVTRVEPKAIGRAIVAMGGGRQRMDDDIDPVVGVVIVTPLGTRVTRGQHLALVHARDGAGVEVGRAALHEAITIGDEAPMVAPLVSHRVTARGVEVVADSA